MALQWGFRRCEDICWIKTNKERRGDRLRGGGGSLLQPSKEHCLMGIRGTVRRSTDAHLIHANVDTDVIIAEEPPVGSTEKPEELYRLIEHFAQGRRRLELFGRDGNIRAGWVTVGNELSSSNFSPEVPRASTHGLPGINPESEIPPCRRMPKTLWTRRGEALSVGEAATRHLMPPISWDSMPKLNRFVPNHLHTGIMCKCPFHRLQVRSDMYIAT